MLPLFPLFPLLLVVFGGGELLLFPLLITKIPLRFRWRLAPENSGGLGKRSALLMEDGLPTKADHKDRGAFAGLEVFVFTDGS